MPKENEVQRTERARNLRRTQTKSEDLLWAVLRARQLCGLKFRRQHPIGPFIVDFACVSESLVVEIDGGYHDAIGEKDLERETFIRQQGWEILRFTDKEVESDPETVARGIATHLGREYQFTRRRGHGSGMMRRPK